MLEGDLHTGAFITTAKCRLLKLHKEDFHRLETANPQVAENIRKTAAARRAARAQEAASKQA
jgi:voltage-gated potassium channel